MITEEIFKTYIKDHLNSIPACSCICIPKIKYDYNSGMREFTFYINIHDLCWYIRTEEELKLRKSKYGGRFEYFTLRDLKIYSILNI